MTVRLLALLVVAVALPISGCAGEPAENSAQAEPAQNSAQAEPAPNSADTALGSDGRCTLPRVELERGDAALAAHFAPGSRRFADLQANVTTGFRAACDKGLISGSTIPDLEKVSLERLTVENIPDGNDATLSADQLTGGVGWRLMLEYPFVASDGSINVPSAADIEEAVYCALRATEQEMRETGRCLVD